MGKRKVEIFSAGCQTCEDTIKLVKDIACSSCEITILDMSDADVAKRASSLGVRSIPAVAVDGKLADCCQNGGVSKSTLQAAGIGQA